jgi:exonuclease VII small subunit
MENERKGFEEKRAQLHNDIVDLENRVEKLDDELQNWEDNFDTLL